MQRYRFSVLTLFALSGVLLGCRPNYGGDMNAALGVPAPGSVRIVTTRIEATPERLHYKWSLIGSVNWREATANGNDLSLSNTYPFNSTTERGGCNVYEADLTANKATGKWEAILHGSNGTTVHTSGELPAGKSAIDAIQIRQDTPSATIGLPTNLTIASVGDTELHLNVAR